MKILIHGAFDHTCWFCFQVLSHCVKILIHGAFDHACLFCFQELSHCVRILVWVHSVTHVYFVSRNLRDVCVCQRERETLCKDPDSWCIWSHLLIFFLGTFTLCKDPDSWCIRSRLLSTSRPATVYDCDNRHQCQYFNMTSGSSLVCRNVGIGKHLHCIVTCMSLFVSVFSFVSLCLVDSSSEENCQSTNNLKQG